MKTVLQPWWVVGFVDGEGCFRASLLKNAKLRFGYQIQMEFVVVQHQRDVDLLYQLKSFFGCGQVGLAKGVNSPSPVCQFRVRQLDHLQTKILPFFEKYSLYTKKHIEFLKFQELCGLLPQKIHLEEKGFQRCLALAQRLPYQDENKGQLVSWTRYQRPP